MRFRVLAWASTAVEGRVEEVGVTRLSLDRRTHAPERLTIQANITQWLTLDFDDSKAPLSRGMDATGRGGMYQHVAAKRQSRASRSLCRQGENPS